MGVEEHKKHSHGSVNCAVITISSTRSKDEDDSGRTIIESLINEGHNVVNYNLVKDDLLKIRNILETALVDQNTQAVISNGGTGIGKNDITIEAVRPFLEKELTGFGELFRYLSFEEIGSPAILSRAIAGVAKGKIIICLPGSTNACELAMKNLILPELSHMVYEINR